MTLKKLFSCAVIVALFCATAATAQEKLGNVTFTTSCDAKVQPRFKANAKSYFEQLVALTKSADTERPELQEAKSFLAKK